MLLELTGPLEYAVSVVPAVSDAVDATATMATVWPSIPVPELPLWLLTAGGVLAIALLMVISGFFSSSEIAMFALPRHRLDALVETEATNATVVEELRGDPHRLLVTILVGNNVANVAMSSVATALLGFYVSGAQAVLLTTIGITSLVLLFSESAPKSYAIENTESWALRVVRPIRFSEHLLYPFVVVFDKLTRAVNGLVGAETAIESPGAPESRLSYRMDAYLRLRRGSQRTAQAPNPESRERSEMSQGWLGENKREMREKLLTILQAINNDDRDEITSVKKMENATGIPQGTLSHYVKKGGQLDRCLTKSDDDVYRLTGIGRRALKIDWDDLDNFF